VEIHVLQGERQFSKDNRTLGRFILDGIPPAPRGVPKIEVTFDIDANGIMNVNAKDMATSKEQSIRIEASSGLSKEEIDKMVKDAKEHAAEDRKRRELIDAKNSGDQLVYQTEKNLKEMDEKLDATLKNKIEGALTRLKDALKTENLDEIKSATDGLNQTWSEASSKMYQQQGAPQGSPTGAEGPTESTTQDGQEKVEEADYEVVDDDNKDK
jgi:molecular chaperone DnaK